MSGPKGPVDSQADGPLGQAGPPDDGAVVKAERDGVAAAHHGVEPVAVKVASPSVTAGCECFVQCHLFSARIRHNNGLLVLSSVFFVFCVCVSVGGTERLNWLAAVRTG